MSAWSDVVRQLETLTGETSSGSLMNQAANLLETYVGQTSYGSLSARIANAAKVLGTSEAVSGLGIAAGSLENSVAKIYSASLINTISLSLAETS